MEFCYFGSISKHSFGLIVLFIQNNSTFSLSASRGQVLVYDWLKEPFNIYVRQKQPYVNNTLNYVRMANENGRLKI